MKAKFKKKANPWAITTLLVTFAICAIVGIFSSPFGAILFIVWITFAIATLNDYEITAKGKIKGYDYCVNIQRIQKMELHDDGVDIYYNKKVDKHIRKQHFRPKDLEGFIQQIKTINPEIPINKLD